MPDPVLTINDLTVEFKTEDGIVRAVTGVSYDLFPGEVLGIVGESGSGKSVSMLSVLGLIPQPPGRIANGEAIFGNLLGNNDGVTPGLTTDNVDNNDKAFSTSFPYLVPGN